MRRVLPVLVFLLVCATSLRAQEMEDVLYLKNGTVVRGMIVEQIPNQQVRIRTRDGSTYVYTFDLIARIAREPAAQEPTTVVPQMKHARKGFWIGFGGGFGSLGVEDGDTRESSGAATFKLGGTLSQSLLLGVQVDAWTKTVDSFEGSATLTFGTVTALVVFYPMSNGGLYLSGGIGVATLTGEISSGGLGISETKGGPGGVVGIGYDIRLGRNFSLTPYFNFSAGNINLAEGTSMGVNMFQTGLAVNWH